MNIILNGHGTRPTIIDPLTPAELQDLRSYEETIHAGLQTFVEVGLALAAIRDGRLYRAEFPTFEEYCQEKWGMTARRARQLWAAAEIVRTLGVVSHDYVVPATESQARPLTLLPEDQRIPAWEEVLRTAPLGRVTARHVQSVVDSRLGRPAKAPASPPNERSAPAPDRPPIDAGKREDELRAIANRAIAHVRELVDAIGTPDSAAAAGAIEALDQLQEFTDHLAHLGKLQSARPG